MSRPVNLIPVQRGLTRYYGGGCYFLLFATAENPRLKTLLCSPPQGVFGFGRTHRPLGLTCGVECLSAQTLRR
jgi:hypothetical protein